MALILPTRLTQEQTAEFKSLYKKHYDIDLSDLEAEEQGVRILQFITIIIESNHAFFEE